MTNTTPLTAGINFPWKYIKEFFMCVRSFDPMVEINGDKVGSPTLGIFGIVNAELPNPDVEPQERILSLPIKHQSDYKSLTRAHIDKGVKNGTNELIILYENRRNLIGQPKACFHVSIYPTGTWNSFFEAVTNYKAQEYRWPRPLILYQPSSNNFFPTTENIFSK